MTFKKTIDRRTFLRGSTALAALAPFGGMLGSTSAFAQDAANPFGVAEGSTVDAVIFNGGYGIDYVEFAASLMQKNHPSVTVKVSPSTQIAQELQPRFLGGNPPDLIDNSGAQAIGFSAIIDQLEDMNSVLDAPSLEGVKIRDTLVGGVEKPGTFGDKFIALNYVMTVYAIWYSAQLFEDNGWTRRPPGPKPSSWARRPRKRASTCSAGARKPRPTTAPPRSPRRSRKAATRCVWLSTTSPRLLVAPGVPVGLQLALRDHPGRHDEARWRWHPVHRCSGAVVE